MKQSEGKQEGARARAGGPGAGVQGGLCVGEGAGSGFRG